VTSNKVFKLQPKADQDLTNIYHYSIQEFGEKRAERYIKDLSVSFEKLAVQPELGRDYSFVRTDLLAFAVVSHVIF